MHKELDDEALISALDHALLKQAELWRSHMAECFDATSDGEQAWLDEFLLLVTNRLAKMQRQQVLAQVCQPIPRAQFAHAGSAATFSPLKHLWKMPKSD